MNWNDLTEEMRARLEIEIQQNIERGMSPEEARYAALRAFGNLTQAQEETRAVWAHLWLENLWQDLRYGWRALRRSPGFTLVAVLSLALGIGANTAIFSVLDAVLLKSLPVLDPEQLVVIESPRGSWSNPMYREMARRQEVFSGVLASGSISLLRVRIEGQDELPASQIQARVASGNYFSTLGVQAQVGRTFTEDDDPQVAVISHGFWERRFARDASIIGRRLLLDHTAFTVLGVMPQEFFGETPGLAPDLWLPIAAFPRFAESRTMSWLNTMGRLKPGAERRQAEVALTVLYRQLMAEEIASGQGSRQPPRLEDMRITLEPGTRGRANLRRRLAEPLGILMGVVALVLLIACSNVANLLLARATARRKEIGIRLAIGAGRGRLVRQFLTESILLGLLGGAVGLGLAFLTTDLLVAMAAEGGLPLQLALRPDWRILSFTAAISLAASLLFGLAPALRAGAGGREPGVGGRWGTGLVAVQIALTLVLLIGAGLLVRTLRNFSALGAGLRRDHVLLVEVRPDSAAIKREQLPGLVRLGEERLNGLPGVRSAALAEFGLFTGSGTTAPVRAPESPVKPTNDHDIRQVWVTPLFFETVGMRMVLGRRFTPQDGPGAPKVAVLNETMARHYFGAENPLGKRIYFPKLDAQGRYVPFEEAMGPDQALEIVGVVEDAKYDNLRQKTPRMTFLPWSQGTPTPSAVAVAVRTLADPAAAIGPVRQALKEIHPDMIIRNVRTLEQQIDRTLGQERLIAKLLTFFGVLALLLASVGLYGVMSYGVARRTHEIGIRLALGAQPGELLRRVLGKTLRVALLGVALGLPLALAATRLVENFLFGLTRHDPATLVLAAACLVGVAVVAGYWPARRASRVDPVVALRHDP